MNHAKEKIRKRHVLKRGSMLWLNFVLYRWKKFLDKRHLYSDSRRTFVNLVPFIYPATLMSPSLAFVSVMKTCNNSIMVQSLKLPRGKGGRGIQYNPATKNLDFVTLYFAS